MDEPSRPLVTPETTPALIGRLPEHFDLPEGMSHDVQISYQTYEHIVERRTQEEAWHVQFVLDRITGVVETPSHVGHITKDLRKVEVYYKAKGDKQGVVVSLKCLQGETWVNTAYPIGDSRLRKHLKSGKLKPVEVLQVLLFPDEI